MCGDYVAYELFCAISTNKTVKPFNQMKDELKQQLVPETYFYLLELLEVSMDIYKRYSTIKKVM